MADSVVVGGWMFATEKHLGRCFIIAILVLFAATILYVQIINFVCLVQERFIFYSNKTRRHDEEEEYYMNSLSALLNLIYT